MGIFTSTGSFRRVPLIGISYFILVAMPLLVISSLVQDWAVLVGTESGLQVVYPLGLHRFLPKSRLVGDLVDAELHVSKIDARGRLKPAHLAFECVRLRGRFSSESTTVESTLTTRAALPNGFLHIAQHLLTNSARGLGSGIGIWDTSPINKECVAMTKRWPAGAAVALMAVLASTTAGAEAPVVTPMPTGDTLPIIESGDVLSGHSTDSLATPRDPAADFPIWAMAAAATVPSAMTRLVGDVTGDGREDVVGFEVGIYVIPGGEPAPGSLLTYEPSLWVEEAALGDVNGDGVADLIVLKPSEVVMYPGGVSGGLGTGVSYPVGSATDVVVADVNSDGRDDVVSLSASGLHFLVQSPSGSLEVEAYPQAPDPGSHERFAAGDVDGDGSVDFISWPGVPSTNASGNPRIYLQTEPAVWEEAGWIAMESSGHHVWTIDMADLDRNGADEIAVSVMVSGAPDRYARLYWQEPGQLNTEASVIAACREPHFAFADADANGLMDLACQGDAGIVLYRQVDDRTFLRDFYLNSDGRTSRPVMGDFTGDDRTDLAVTYTDGSYEARVYEGVSPADLAANPATIQGAMETASGALDDICVEAISAHTGSVLAYTISAGGRYSLDVPEGTYVLRYSDCRPHPRSPTGMSYLGYIWGATDPIFVIATRGSTSEVDLYTELHRDMTGVIVDDVSSEPLGGIRVWEGIKDWRISGYYWIANSTETDSTGRFTKYGSYRQIDVFMDDPLGVYPPHTLYVHDDPGDLGTLGLLDPIMRDIRDSIFLDDILWLRSSGVTKGCNPPANDMFCTDARVTRGQMAAFLVRFLGLSGTGMSSFVDDDDSIFEANIELLADAGITRGCNPPVNDRFCPHDYVTRGQMAAFLTRALNLDDSGVAEFIDDDGLVFEDAIEKLATAGITRGCNPPVNDRFCPHGYVTRGQMAAFLARSAVLRP